MIIHIPTQVFLESFIQRGSNQGGVDGNMMFEPVLANVLQQFLEMGNFYHAITAKGFKRIVGQLTFSQIAELLSISSNTVASRYRYALAKLREVMRDKENSSGAF